MEKFIEWLEEKMADRGWSQADLSRHANISKATVSNVLSGKRKPGIEFLVAIANSFKIPPEDVFRAAELFPSTKNMDRELVKILNTIAPTLTDDQLQSLIAAAETMEKQNKRK
jgi:transcriptional regulator with XRE-family HTH domain